MFIDWTGSGNPFDPVNIGISTGVDDLEHDELEHDSATQVESHRANTNFTQVNRNYGNTRVKNFLRDVENSIHKYQDIKNIPIHELKNRKNSLDNFRRTIDRMLQNESIGFIQQRKAEKLKSACSSLSASLSKTVNELEREQITLLEKRGQALNEDTEVLSVEDYEKFDNYDENDFHDTTGNAVQKIAISHNSIGQTEHHIDDNVGDDNCYLFSAGNYYVGEDIPPGRYDVAWVSGRGWCSVEDAQEDYRSFGFFANSEDGILVFRNADLISGEKIRVRTTLKVRFIEKQPSYQKSTKYYNTDDKMIAAVKNSIDESIKRLGDSIDQALKDNYIKFTVENVVYTPHRIINNQLINFCLYLCASAESLTDSDANFISIVFETEMSVEQLKSEIVRSEIKGYPDVEVPNAFSLLHFIGMVSGEFTFYNDLLEINRDIGSKFIEYTVECDKKEQAFLEHINVIERFLELRKNKQTEMLANMGNEQKAIYNQGSDFLESMKQIIDIALETGDILQNVLERNGIFEDSNGFTLRAAICTQLVSFLLYLGFLSEDYISEEDVKLVYTLFSQRYSTTMINNIINKRLCKDDFGSNIPTLLKMMCEADRIMSNCQYSKMFIETHKVLTTGYIGYTGRSDKAEAASSYYIMLKQFVQQELNLTEDNTSSGDSLKSFGAVRSKSYLSKNTAASDLSFAAHAKPQNVPDFKKGDNVNHSAFGLGVIRNITPAGSDTMLEIDFANGVTKRLMLKSAMRYLENPLPITPISNFKYVKSSYGVKITKYEDCTNADKVARSGVIIPNEINGYPVIEIGENAFTSVDIDWVLIPDSVFEICEAAFSSCSLRHVVMPSSLIKIGKYAFMDCKKLKSVTIPKSLKIIGKQAFANCSGMTKITIHSGLTYINERVFENCSALSALRIPESIEQILEYAFAGCIELITVKFDEGISVVAEFAFSGCTKLRNVIIPDSLKYISESAFTGCVSLKDEVKEHIIRLSQDTDYDMHQEYIDMDDMIRETNWG